jgi:hypothetical protein
VNQYLDSCETRVKSGELSAVSLADYHFVGKLMVKHLGRHVDPGQLQPTDFREFRAALAKRYALTRLSKSVTVCRQIIHWAWESEIIDTMPRFGPDFATVSKKVMKLHRQKTGGKTLTIEEIRQLLNVADATWKKVEHAAEVLLARIDRGEQIRFNGMIRRMRLTKPCLVNPILARSASEGRMFSREIPLACASGYCRSFPEFHSPNTA